MHQPPARTSRLLSPPAPASPPSRAPSCSTQGPGAGLSQHDGFATGAFIVREVILPALHQAELSKSARSWPPPPGAHPRSLHPQMLLLMYSSISRATWGKCQNIVLPGISCSHQCLDKHEGKGMTTVWKMPETSLAQGPQCPPGTVCHPPHLYGIRWPRSAGHGLGTPQQLSPDPGTLLQDGPPGTSKCLPLCYVPMGPHLHPQLCVQGPWETAPPAPAACLPGCPTCLFRARITHQRSGSHVPAWERWCRLLGGGAGVRRSLAPA